MRKLSIGIDFTYDDDDDDDGSLKFNECIRFIRTRMDATNFVWKDEYVRPGELYRANIILEEGQSFGKEDRKTFASKIEEMNESSPFRLYVVHFSKRKRNI